MSDLDDLLALQANDTTADQLRHRRETLPQRSRLVELVQERAAVEAGVVDPRARRDELAREQLKLEDEIGRIESKRVQVDKQLYGEGLTSPKEAQALQADLESLKRRQDFLEEQVLELMEQIEPLDAELSSANQALTANSTEHEEVTAALAAAEVDLDAELERVAEARSALVDAVPASLLAEYERLRPQYGGVAVARLDHGTCQGCFLTLAAAEVDEIRRAPADALLHCPDCGRLLVR
ncbi:MAG TPA: C4-type zinc ribbon domain-containing protein [Acidimicrobiales bacterium]